MTFGVTAVRRCRVRHFALCVSVLLVLASGPGAGDTALAALLAVGGTRRFHGVGGLVTGLVAGAVIGAAIGYAAVAVLAVPLSSLGTVSLGIALGGGVGVVTNYLATGDEESVDETMTVEQETERVSPTPADLFDGHPDPILYVADEGHGAVVRAANAAYASTFDVPADAVIGAPLADAVMASSETETVVDAVERGDGVDDVVTCSTPDGDTAFRLRTAGAADDGYLLYTPVND